jgi:hypothetical protein
MNESKASILQARVAKAERDVPAIAAGLLDRVAAHEVSADESPVPEAVEPA